MIFGCILGAKMSPAGSQKSPKVDPKAIKKHLKFQVSFRLHFFTILNDPDPPFWRSRVHEKLFFQFWPCLEKHLKTIKKGSQKEPLGVPKGFKNKVKKTRESYHVFYRFFTVLGPPRASLLEPLGLQNDLKIEPGGHLGPQASPSDPPSHPRTLPRLVLDSILHEFSTIYIDLWTQS